MNAGTMPNLGLSGSVHVGALLIGLIIGCIAVPPVGYSLCGCSVCVCAS